MANSPQAKKRIRQTVRKTQVNHRRISRMRSSIRKVEDALGAGNGDAARSALGVAIPEIARSARKGIIHSNTAARKVSRLNARVKALVKA